VPMYQEVKAILKQIAQNKKDKIRSEESSTTGEDQPLHQNGSLPNRLQNQMYASSTNQNKEEFVFQKTLRRTLSRILTISRPSQ